MFRNDLWIYWRGKFHEVFTFVCSSGGVVILAFEGRIICDNTLDQRLALAFEQRLPDVRKTLFGASVTRRFLD